MLLELKSEMTQFWWKMVYIVGRTHTLREVPNILENEEKILQAPLFSFPPGHQLDSLVSRWFTP